MDNSGIMFDVDVRTTQRHWYQTYKMNGIFGRINIRRTDWLFFFLSILRHTLLDVLLWAHGKRCPHISCRKCAAPLRGTSQIGQSTDYSNCGCFRIIWCSLLYSPKSFNSMSNIVGLDNRRVKVKRWKPSSMQSDGLLFIWITSNQMKFLSISFTLSSFYVNFDFFSLSFCNINYFHANGRETAHTHTQTRTHMPVVQIVLFFWRERKISY